MSTEHHSAEIDSDEDGWWWAVCACGWQSGPCPGREDATDAWGDHREALPPIPDSED